MSSIVVAIDGPAGAGKSTVAKLVASHLRLRYLDTGAMYRATALLATEAGFGLDDVDAIADLIASSSMEFDGAGLLLVNGTDISSQIRTPEMSQLASELSAFPQIRRVLAARQQQMVEAGGFVLEGRDTTTVIAPNATVKIFLTASLEERAERRLIDLRKIGREMPFDQLLLEISERDHRDYTRQDSPLRRAADAVVVETYGLTPMEVAEKILSLVRSRAGSDLH